MLISLLGKPPCEGIGVALEPVQFRMSKFHHEITVLCASQHNRERPASGSKNICGSVVAVKGVERHTKGALAFFPFGLHGEHSMSEIAQRAVRATEAGANPIRDFADQRGVCVIDTDVFDDV